MAIKKVYSTILGKKSSPKYAFTNFTLDQEDYDERKAYKQYTLVRSFDKEKVCISRKDVPAGVDFGNHEYWVRLKWEDTTEEPEENPYRNEWLGFDALYPNTNFGTLFDLQASDISVTLMQNDGDVDFPDNPAHDTLLYRREGAEFPLVVTGIDREFLNIEVDAENCDIEIGDQPYFYYRDKIKVTDNSVIIAEPTLNDTFVFKFRLKVTTKFEADGEPVVTTYSPYYYMYGIAATNPYGNGIIDDVFTENGIEKIAIAPYMVPGTKVNFQYFWDAQNCLGVVYDADEEMFYATCTDSTPYYIQCSVGTQDGPKFLTTYAVAQSTKYPRVYFNEAPEDAPIGSMAVINHTTDDLGDDTAVDKQYILYKKYVEPTTNNVWPIIYPSERLSGWEEYKADTDQAVLIIEVNTESNATSYKATQLLPLLEAGVIVIYKRGEHLFFVTRYNTSDSIVYATNVEGANVFSLTHSGNSFTVSVSTTALALSEGNISRDFKTRTLTVHGGKSGQASRSTRYAKFIYDQNTNILEIHSYQGRSGQEPTETRVYVDLNKDGSTLATVGELSGDPERMFSANTLTLWSGDASGQVNLYHEEIEGAESLVMETGNGDKVIIPLTDGKIKVQEPWVETTSSSNDITVFPNNVVNNKVYHSGTVNIKLFPNATYNPEATYECYFGATDGLEAITFGMSHIYWANGVNPSDTFTEIDDAAIYHITIKNHIASFEYITGSTVAELLED